MPALAKNVDLAAAVVTSLVAGGWTTASRAYDLDLEPEDLESLKVVVVPYGYTTGMAARGGTHIDNGYTVHVGLLRKLDTTDHTASAAATAEIDALVLHLENIIAHLYAAKLTILIGFAMMECTPIAGEDAPFWSPDMLHERRIFQSVLRLKFRRVT
jgi:hypothetical protein